MPEEETSGRWVSAEQISTGERLAYDPQTGYYFDPKSGYYVDYARQLYYHPSTQEWYFYDHAAACYKPVPRDGTQGAGTQDADIAHFIESAMHSGQAAAPAAPVAPAPAAALAPAVAPQPLQLNPSVPIKVALSVNQRKASGSRLKISAPRAQSVVGELPVSAATETPAAAPAPATAAPAKEPSDALVDFEALVCRLCARKFASRAVLEQHEAKSDLHRQNLQKKLAEARKEQEAQAYKMHMDAVRALSVGKDNGGAVRPLTK